MEMGTGDLGGSEDLSSNNSSNRNYLSSTYQIPGALAQCLHVLPYFILSILITSLILQIRKQTQQDNSTKTSPLINSQICGYLSLKNLSTPTSYCLHGARTHPFGPVYH